MTSDFCIALHALVYLDHKACAVSSEILADNICTNPVRVRKVMAKLKAADMICTKEGAEGGYRISADPETTSLADIAAALDTAFVEMNWLSGNPDKDCLISSGMADVMTDILNDLDAICIGHLKKTSLADVSRMLFCRHKEKKQ